MNREKYLIYRVFCSMKQRCFNKNHKDFKNYGQRGIIICDRWLKSFEDFYNDMGPRPNNNYTIERRNNNLNYCPENCYWATRKEQNSNKRNNRLFTYNGKTKGIIE